jgi:hypothetical protein
LSRRNADVAEFYVLLALLPKGRSPSEPVSCRSIASIVLRADNELITAILAARRAMTIDVKIICTRRQIGDDDGVGIR